MDISSLSQTYIEALLTGNRNQARNIIRKAIASAVKPQEIYRQILFPAMEKVENMYRANEISILIRNLATRINRFITDQVQAQLIPSEQQGKSAVIICAQAETEELGAQMCCDLLESAGWNCYFLGGGVPEDEITAFLGQITPDILVIYGSLPSGVPLTRQLIERIHDIGACPLMNIIVTGGIFNRVEGLWEEIKADFYATDPVNVVDVAMSMNPKLHLPRNPSAPKRRRRLATGPITTAPAAVN